MTELPKRKTIRLPTYDYSQNGAYFITVCAKDKERIFGKITVGQGLCSCRLSEAGHIVESEIEQINEKYGNVFVDKYIVMPNHVHLLIRIDTFRQELKPCPTISDVVCALKSVSTKKINKANGTSGATVWQSRFYDHVVRNEKDYKEIWEYIDTNPYRWTLDKYYEKT